MTRKYSFEDIIVLAFIAVIGAGEMSHLYGVFFRHSLSECIPVFVGISCGAIVLLVIAAMIIWHINMIREAKRKKRDKITFAEIILGCFVVLIALSQILYLTQGIHVYLEGDMTVETVNSFLQSNGIYSVNPLTGAGYTEGIPSRIKILGLMTIYAEITEILGMKSYDVVWYVVPVTVALVSYTAYGSVAKSLFPEERKSRLVFMIAVLCILWVGSYSFGMDGYGLLFSGWRGVSIRNLILVPYVVAACLRKNALLSLVCIVAEACITWTLYGMGVCLVVAVGIVLMRIVCSRITFERRLQDD